MVSALTQTGCMAFNSCIYQLYKHLLSAYDWLGTTLGAENSAVKKTDRFLFSQNFHFS